jgi:glycerophosphoryl diester phosphodiesterase
MATKITARAGCDGESPENTLAAIRRSVAAGADRIELDVQMSCDGIVLLHHFYQLGETDDGEGLIYEHDSAYLRSLDAGSWFAPAFQGEQIPLLEEVFATVGDAVEYELDLRGFTPDCVPAVLALVRRYGLLDRTEFTSAYLFVLAQVKRLAPEATTGMFVHYLCEPWMSPEMAHTIIRNNAALGDVGIAHYGADMLTAPAIAALRQDGRKVHAANCNTEEDLAKAFALGVDQLSTDRLTLALSLRSRFIAGDLR